MAGQVLDLPSSDDVAERIEAQIAAVAGHLNAQHARLVDLTAEAIATDACVGGGYLGPAHWLTLHAGLSSARARQIADLATRSVDYPEVMARFRAGMLSLDQVTAAMSAPVWADRRVAEFAEVATVHQIRTMIRTAIDPAPVPPTTDEPAVDDDAQPASEPGTSRADASVGFGWGAASTFWLSASGLTVDQGRLVEAALVEARDHLFRNGHPAVGWADALVELARRALDHTGMVRAERVKNLMHVDTTSGTATLTNGVPVPPTVRDYLLCDSLVQPVWERDGLPVGVGRSTRSIPERLRRQVHHRDQGCVVEGCANTLGLEAHHITPWGEGGATELENLVLICDPHHHRVHAGEIALAGNPNLPRGAPGSLRVLDRHGRPVRRHPTPKPPDGEPPSPTIGYTHPTGEHCDYSFIHWKPPSTDAA